MTKFAILFTLCTALISVGAFAGDISLSDTWCIEHGGEPQVGLVDGTEADCVLPDRVVEFEILDESSKVYEAIGQVLHYSTATKKLAHLVLMPKGKRGSIYLNRINSIIAHHNLKITVETYQPKSTTPIEKILSPELPDHVHQEVIADDLPVNLEIENAEGKTLDNSSPIQLNPVSPKLCCKQCGNGMACGDTCIRKGYTCNRPPGCACDGATH